MNHKLLLAGCLSALAPMPAAQAQTAPSPELVLLGHGVVGALYQPAEPGPKAEIAVYVMHAEQDYLQFSACTELSARGYTVLCANNSASKSGFSNDLDFETMMLDVARGMTYLRERPDVQRVVLFGHSGGGAMMAAYQNVAENGLPACQGPEKIVPCSDALADLPAADGVILADANYGLSGMVLLSLDPAVTDEASGTALDPGLDLFSAENGFTPEGATYPDAFRQAFQAGVAARMTRLIDDALARQAAMTAGEGRFADDEPLVIPGANYIGFNNKLFAQDPTLLSHTSEARPLVHADGSITTEVVSTVRPASNLESNTASYWEGALKTTVNRFLSTFAIRVDPDFSYDEDGLDLHRFCSGQMLMLGGPLFEGHG